MSAVTAAHRPAAPRGRQPRLYSAEATGRLRLLWRALEARSAALDAAAAGGAHGGAQGPAAQGTCWPREGSSAHSEGDAGKTVPAGGSHGIMAGADARAGRHSG